MNYSIVSATIPSATKLVKSLSTNYGVAYGVNSQSGGYGAPSQLHSNSNRYADASNPNDGSIALTSLKSMRHRISANAGGKDQFRILTSKEDMNYSYEINSPPHAPKQSFHGFDRARRSMPPASRAARARR